MTSRHTIHLEFMESSLTMTSTDGTGLQKKILYSGYPHIRNLVQKMMNVLATEHEKALFAYLCCHCGNCCGEREIVVTEEEITRLARHLQLSPEDMRKAFIEPSYTWNSEDGALKKKDGACICLKRASTGRSFCTIYPVRPSYCEDRTQPSTEMCRKDWPTLIHEFERVTVFNDRISMLLKTGAVHEAALTLPLLRSMMEHIVKIAGTDSKRAFEGGETLPGPVDLLFSPESEGVSSTLYPRDEALACSPEEGHDGLVTGNGSHHGGNKPRGLLNRPEPVRCHETAAPAGINPEGFRILPESLELIFEKPGGREQRILHYHDNPSLLLKARALHQALLEESGEELLAELFKGNTHCYRCGSCCLNLRVEIAPGDIYRLAEHFGLSLDEFRRRYLQPSLHSWNESAGCISRKTESSSQRKGCQFLSMDKKQAACTVYEARPDVCRGYLPDKKSCIAAAKAQGAAPVKRRSPLASLDIIESCAHLLTQRRKQEGLPPYSFSLTDEPHLATLITGLEEEARRLLHP